MTKKTEEIEVLRAENDALKKTVQELNEQLKELFRTEKVLYQQKLNLDLQNDRINALNDFNLEAWQKGSIDGVMETVVKLFMAVFPFDSCAIFLKNTSGRIASVICKDSLKDTVQTVQIALPITFPREFDILSEPTFFTDKKLADAWELFETLFYTQKVNYTREDDCRNGVMVFPIRSEQVSYRAIALSKVRKFLHPFSDNVEWHHDQAFLKLVQAHIEDIVEKKIHQEKLEKTVRERTLQLSLKNEELQESLGKLTTAQKQLLQAERMAALGEMAGGVAHEINNPLSIILGRSRQLRNRMERDEVDKELVISTNLRIESMVDRIARIVRGLRAFAREGENDPFEMTSVRKIVDETLELCRAKFDHHGTSIKVGEIPVEFMISCRATQISQILLNLLSNAYDAVEGTDHNWVRIEFKDLKDGFELRVIDGGLGIPKEWREKMMEPFFTTKSIGKGTGLGLSISKGIAESHGGQLFLDTEAPNTTFVLKLPIFPPENITAPKSKV